MTPDEAERLARLRAACPGWRFSHEQTGSGIWHFVATFGDNRITTLTVSALARKITELGDLAMRFGERYGITVKGGKWIAERDGRFLAEASAGDLATAIKSDVAEIAFEAVKAQIERDRHRIAERPIQ